MVILHSAYLKQFDQNL